ncbi:MAG: helix-turn-helix domain-containing protein [Prevotella sp.]|nr:helix-turn-helix domain-containing protein [Prevotella sp.]
MKRLKTILMLTLILLSLSAGSIYLFKILDTSKGLTCSQVNCIMKDSRGYMWFGTPAGLYRYDGYTFKKFQSDPQNGSSLPDSYIKSIQEGMDGDLWIETSSGYCIYHPQTESFERDIKSTFSNMGINTSPSLIFIDSHKNLWAYTPNHGVDCFNMQQQLLYNFGYTNTSTGIPQGNIVSMGESKEGTILAYDDGRIVCCDVMHQQHTAWANQTLTDLKIKSNDGIRVFADSNDNIWLYGPGTLLKYNKNTSKWDMSIGTRLGFKGTGTDRAVNGMDEDKNGNIWIATDVNGLLKMNVLTNKVEAVKPQKLDGAINNIEGIIKTQSVYVDDTNLIWVGTQKYGVAYWGKNIYKFMGKAIGDVSAICEGPNGKILYGTEDEGLIGYDGAIASKKITALAYTKDGSLWIGSMQNGLTRIRNGKTKFYSAVNDSSKTVIDDHINALTTDRNGNLWIATLGGLQVFNPNMNTFSTYTKENGKMMSNNITSLYYTKNNRLLIGTSDGLIIMKLSNNEMTYYTGNSTNMKTFTNNYITNVYQDSRGLIWIGTREGLNIFNEETDSLKYITENNGLCNNSICGITEDNNNNIWVTTSNGASRIVVERNNDDNSFNYGLYNYDISDGLQSNEFNNGALFTRKDGQVIFGGIYGINWVMPESNVGKNSLPRVMLTQLFIGDNEIETSNEYQGRIPLPQALNESNKITLRNNENTFTIKFAAGNYNQSERLQFVYWMEGLDNQWHNGDALKHGVTFNDLVSGSYTLHVKAISANGSVSNHERTLKIVIERPWWMSWWMFLCYTIISVIIFFIWKIGFKKFSDIWLRKKAILHELMLQRDEIKETSNELRQPMARMTSIISNLAERESSIEGREQLNALHSQVLQVITRISEMQILLESPKKKAKNRAFDKLEMDKNGQVTLPSETQNELTYEIKPQKKELPTMRFLVIMIDDNEEFLRFTAARLSDFYTFQTYSNIETAASDLDDLKADLVICKQDMQEMTGSELCNKLKMSSKTQSTKFILMTDTVLSPADIKKKNITLSADDYLAKPFNIQEAMIVFNQLLGIGDINLNNLIANDSICGDDKSLEWQNSSMTRASINYENADNELENKNHSSKKYLSLTDNNVDKINYKDSHSKERIIRRNGSEKERKPEKYSPKIGKRLFSKENDDADIHEKLDQEAIQVAINDNIEANSPNNNENFDIKNVSSKSYQEYTNIENDYSMADATDMQLIRNIEQYVMQNMSRGQLNLEEMAASMGMGRVPFFHKITNITHKTPAEFIRNLRIKHACELLIRTNINMNEIAQNIGFTTAENFIHIFKEKFGITPLEYRIESRENNK